MATIMRHGGEAHVVRPDRVYRTGVLSPIVGYQPGADVQAVAAAFTLGPPSGMDLQGLGAINLGPIQRLIARVKAAIAAKKAAKFMTVASVQGPPAPQAPGPSAAIAAAAIAPDQAGRAAAVFRLVGPNMGTGVGAESQYVAAMRRMNTYYRAG